MKRKGRPINEKILTILYKALEKEEKEEKELDHGCWEIGIPCNDLMIFDEAEDHDECPIDVEVEPQKDYEQSTTKSIIEDKLINSSIFIQQEQQYENEFYKIDYMIDDRSHPTYDEYLPKIKYFEMIENDSSPTYDEYLTKSEYFEMIENDSPPIYDEYPLEIKFDTTEIIKNDSLEINNKQSREKIHQDWDDWRFYT